MVMYLAFNANYRVMHPMTFLSYHNPVVIIEPVKVLI